MILTGGRRALESRGDGVVDGALAATEPRRAQDSVGDEALGRADRVLQAHAAREARRDCGGERTARAVRRGRFDSLGEEGLRVVVLVKQEIERPALEVPALPEP